MKTSVLQGSFDTELNATQRVPGILRSSFTRCSKSTNQHRRSFDEDIQACFQHLKQLVPVARSNVRLSKFQILQHVIDYILDLETKLDVPIETDVQGHGHDIQETIQDLPIDEEDVCKPNVRGSNLRKPLSECALVINKFTSTSSQQQEKKSNKVDDS